MASGSPILGALDAEELSNRGFLRPSNTAGMRRLHRRRAYRSSDEENHDIPLSVDPINITDQVFVTIPDILISKETLLYLGFEPAKAEQLWSSWWHWPASGPRRETGIDDGGEAIYFQDFVRAHISASESPDTWSEQDAEWAACFTSYGINADVQAAILDPLFTEIRLTETAAYWVDNTVAMRFAGLVDIQRASREREMRLRRAASRAKASTSTQGDAGEGSSAAGQIKGFLGLGEGEGGGQRRSISGLQADAAPGISVDTASSIRAVAARNAPGSVVLYKAIDQAHISNLFDEHGAVSRLQTLLSSSPSDFSGNRAMYYFTPDYKIAEYYAAYAKRRANCESIVLITITIANSVIESMESPEIQRVYWPNTEWRQLIWHSRCNETLPKHLRKYRLAILTIGNIAKCPNETYLRMSSWEAVEEKHLLNVDGARAVQCVISDEDEGREWLMENGGRNLKAYPFTREELRLWSDDRLALTVEQ